MTIDEARAKVLAAARANGRKYQLPKQAFGDDMVMLREAMDQLVNEGLARYSAPGRPDDIVLV